jgi:hypothetical protein
LNRKNKPSTILILAISILLSVSFAKPVSAIIPQVTNVDVWNSGGNTILNVTVFHDPENTLHHVDEIQVDVEGSIQTFPVEVQPTTTFTIPCNLGPIQGTPSTTIKAHCTVNGWSQTHGPIEIPEFSPPALLLTLALATLSVVLVFRKISSDIHKRANHR